MLKYTFQVTYKDGTIYTQNPEDISVTDSTRSCFYDVKQEEVKSFFLFNDEHNFSVNLEDGHFELDGVPFLMHEENDMLKDFRLIFWRRHTHSFNQENGEELSHNVVYRFGWQCTVDGKNYQQIMQIY